MGSRSLLAAAASAALALSAFSCGNDLSESSTAALTKVDESSSRDLLLDDGQTGFEMLPPDEYHHFPRDEKVWESWTSVDAENGSYLRAPCGDTRGTGSVLVWNFDLPQGNHEFSVRLPPSADQRSSVVYCVMWDQPKADSDCLQIDQNQKGWVGLGKHAAGGRVQVVVDPLVCTSYDSATAYVVADAVRVTPETVVVASNSVPRDPQ